MQAMIAVTTGGQVPTFWKPKSIENSINTSIWTSIWKMESESWTFLLLSPRTLEFYSTSVGGWKSTLLHFPGGGEIRGGLGSVSSAVVCQMVVATVVYVGGWLWPWVRVSSATWRCEGGSEKVCWFFVGVRRRGNLMREEEEWLRCWEKKNGGGRLVELVADGRFWRRERRSVF